jgi:glycosyltransferase involved in cell wall biosynthesis
MKLTVIGPTYPFRGGVSHYTTLLVKTLRQHHSVQFISYSRQYPNWLYPGDSDRDGSAPEMAEEKADGLFDAFNPWAWMSLARRIAHYQSRLVVLSWSVAYWAPFYWLFLRTLKIMARPPAVLFICHNVYEHETSRWKNILAKRILARGDFFIVHSKSDQDHLHAWLKAQGDDRILVSPHPIYRHLRRNSPSKLDARTHLGIKAERVVLFFGFIRHYKGLRYLIESLPEIVSQLPVHLLIAGEVWGDTMEYSRLIEQLGLRDCVTFIPHYVPNDKVENFFAAADLVVIPYLSATQSGILQLAFGFEKPVVATRVGGLPEVIIAGKTGFLIPPCDSAAIARAVIDYYRDDREAEMVENIRQEASRFSWDEMAATIESVMQQLPEEK